MQGGRAVPARTTAIPVLTAGPSAFSVSSLRTQEPITPVSVVGCRGRESEATRAFRLAIVTAYGSLRSQGRHMQILTPRSNYSGRSNRRSLSRSAQFSSPVSTALFASLVGCRRRQVQLVRRTQAG